MPACCLAADTVDSRMQQRPGETHARPVLCADGHWGCPLWSNRQTWLLRVPRRLSTYARVRWRCSAMTECSGCMDKRTQRAPTTHSKQFLQGLTPPCALDAYTYNRS